MYVYKFKDKNVLPTRIGDSRRDINPGTITKAEGRLGRDKLVT